jgi:hypothetical protein
VTAAGDAVVAMARSQIGVTENPPYSSNVPYWDWWGSPAAGAWCAVFGSWAAYHAGFPLCAVDGWGGYTYCPNGTSHSYPTGEALPTSSIYPGCHVIYSWYGWGFENGVPVINDGSEWTGWVAGDHWGIATSTVDGDGWFTAVEGNTSPTDSGSQDNGGGVWEKWRHIGDVCAWYQPPSYGDAPGIGPEPEPPKPTYNLTEFAMFVLSQNERGIWLMGAGYAKHLGEEEWAQVASLPGLAVYECGTNARQFDVMFSACMAGQMASES